MYRFSGHQRPVNHTRQRIVLQSQTLTIYSNARNLIGKLQSDIQADQVQRCLGYCFGRYRGDRFSGQACQVLELLAAISDSAVQADGRASLKLRKANMVRVHISLG